MTFGDMHVCKPQLEESIAAGKDGPNGGSRMTAGAGEAIAAHYPAQVCLALLLFKTSAAVPCVCIDHQCCCSLETIEILYCNGHRGQSVLKTWCFVAALVHACSGVLGVASRTDGQVVVLLCAECSAGQAPALKTHTFDPSCSFDFLLTYVRYLSCYMHCRS